MINIERTSGLKIDRIKVGGRPFGEIKKHLTRKTIEFTSKNSTILRFYNEIDEDNILIPRYFPIEEYIPNDIHIIDKTNTGKNVNIKHNIKPRDNLQKNSMDFIVENKCGIIKQPPGTGKTVIAIFGICEIGKKTIILMHRDSLVEQWRDRFIEHTDITEDRIGLLKSKTYKEDFEKDIIIATNQTFLSLLKRECKEFLSYVNSSNIGVLVGDEVHTSVGARLFSKCSMSIPARYTFGLSATPERYDKNTDIIEYHLGKINEIEGSGSIMTPVIIMVYFDYHIDEGSHSKYLRWGNKFHRSRYLNGLIKSNDYFNVSKVLINWCLEKDYDIIYMVDRKKIIHKLFEEFKDVDSSKFIENANNETLDHKLVFSTQKKCRDGIDVPDKNVLIMGSPVYNIEQLTGRILRIKEGKKTPLFFDMVDIGCKDMIRSCLYRLDFYKNRGWKIHYFFNKGGPNVKISEPEKFIKWMKEKING